MRLRVTNRLRRKPAHTRLGSLVVWGCATLLLLGYRVRPIAIVLALYCLATAIFFHRNLADQNQMINFLKNIMILGGLLQVVYFGAGPVSIEAARKPARA